MKKSGFIALECIVSMFILSIILYVITFSINNSVNLLNKNKEYLDMLTTLQNYMNEIKHDIKYSKEEINNDIFTINNFEIKKTIIKKDEYYNCYKIILQANSCERSVKLESYVTKK